MKKIVLLVLNFLTMISLFLTIWVIVISLTIFKKEFIMSEIEKNNYYDSVYNKIGEVFKQYIIQSGFDMSIIENIYSKEMVKNDIDSIVNYFYDGSKIEISTEKVRKNLDNEVEKQIKEMEIKKLSSQEISEINSFKDTIIGSYSNEILYSKTYLDKAKNIYNKIPLVKIITLFGISSIILFLLLCLLSKSKEVIINNISKVFMGIGLINIILKIIITNKISNILIMSEHFSKFMIKIASDVLNTICLTGIMLIIFGILLNFLKINRKLY